MGIDKQDHQSTTPRVDTLEKLKGSNFQHFEIVQKNEKPQEYPYNFLRYIKSNWSNICRVMNWLDAKKAPPSFDYFRISKNPENVVKSIQQKIISLGGKLPRYGVDGKFGRETTAALQQIIPTLSAKPQTQPSKPKKAQATPNPTPQNRPQPTPTPTPQPPKQPNKPRQYAPTKPSENAPFSKKLIDQMRNKILSAMPKIQAILAKAGLSFELLEQLSSKKELKQSDVDRIRARTTRLRNYLSRSHPMLHQLNTIFTKASPEITRAFDHIGSSKSLFQGLEIAMRKIEKIFDKYEKQMNLKLDDKSLRKLIDQVGMEKLGAFFIAMVYEVIVSLEFSLRKNNKSLLSLRKS